MHNYKKLSVWKKSVTLATNIYKTTRNYPREELYGITSQIRRNVVSISSNIAEGGGRASQNKFKHFLNIANGSSYELETQLLISKNLSYLTEKEFHSLYESLMEIQKNALFTNQKNLIQINTLRMTG